MTLADDIRSCTRCPLHLQCKAPVPAEVGKNYKTGGLAILAEAPGAEEDKLGRPLVGRAGQLMDALLQGAGISRDDVLLLNTVRCRPPHNRLDRHPEALVACNDWLLAELEAYNPSAVLLTGNTPMRKVYGQQAKITAVRGQPRQTGDSFGYGARCWVPTFHPAYGLRNPAVQGTILDDIKVAVELCEHI